MKALLYGSGAVGIGIAAALMDSGWEVDIKASGETRNAICRNGIRRTGLFREISISPDQFDVYENLSDIRQAMYDYVLICTKAMFNEQTAQDLHDCEDLLQPDGKIVIFQNGWGTDEPYLKHFAAYKVYNARVITGFTRPQRYISEVTVHASPVLIGSLHNQPLDAMIPLAEAIDRGGIPCEVTNEVDKALWAKMLYNCTLNPLGAVLGVNYGRLTESENSVFIMDRIIEEIFTVMKTGGYETYWADADAYKKAFYGELLPPTYNHRSSTLQDIEKKNRTEIDTLTGSVVRLGERLGVAVPYNTMIYHLIKTRECFY